MVSFDSLLLSNDVLKVLVAFFEGWLFLFFSGRYSENLEDILLGRPFAVEKSDMVLWVGHW